MRRATVKAPRGWHLTTPPRWKQSITQIFHLRGVPPTTSEVTAIVVLLLIHLFLLMNLRFEAWPEMVVYPYLMHHGFKLYTDIVNPYPPLFTWFLAGFFKLVGLSILNLKLLTWSLIILIDMLIYRIALKKYGREAALVSLSFFIVFQPLLDGNGLWFDLALVPILLLAFYRQSPLTLVLGFFIKQSMLWYFPLLFKKWRRLFISLFVLFLVSCFLFLVQGNLEDYFFWAWRFPFTLAPFMPGYKDF
ncbi:MAG: hypothetical protein HYS86_05625, partial [Candidatus Chisholmbacteria bacterium]|nr:hypothetical protein [Candidatus Chisholmbacteria bacterium]